MQSAGKWRLTPRRLFLLDGLGACVTAVVLTAMLILFQKAVGMPQFALKVLSFCAVVFAVYSLSCFFFLKKNWQTFLKIIAVANFLYCCLTTFFVIFYFEGLTVLGLCYFLFEITIILSLVFLEIKSTNKPIEK
ncbi:MAG: hypothetical protein K0S23_374 [Fluviicola sp.]|jgi:hypothetical protein|nr:hypothetical protein [Fluviicola sp.]